MPVGAAISAAGALGGAAIGASASKSAASTQASAAKDATNVQQQMYAQTRSDLAPYNAYGQTATSSLSKLLGLDTSGNPVPAAVAPSVGDPNYDAWIKANPDVAKYYAATPSAQTVSLNDFAKDVSTQQAGIRSAVPTYSAADVANWTAPPSAQEQALQALPGYQFTRDQGIQAVNRSLGSQGQTGAQAKGIARFVTGLADSTYNSQVANLAGAAGLGENAAAGTGQIGASYGNGISNTITGAGAASAAGDVGASNAVNGGISSATNSYLANKLFNPSTGSPIDYSGIYSGNISYPSIPDISGA